MKIKTKLLLMAVIPITGLFYFAIKDAVKKLEVVHELNSLETKSELGVVSNLLVHELQKERGMSAGYLGGKGRKFKKELSNQWKVTDQRIRKLKAFLSDFDQEKFRIEFRTNLKKVCAKLFFSDDFPG